MKKRVGIARATVADPELVIYDEPTAGLDPVTTPKIYDLLRADQDAHRRAPWSRCRPTSTRCASFVDEIAFLYEGRILYHGPAGDDRRRRPTRSCASSCAASSRVRSRTFGGRVIGVSVGIGASARRRSRREVGGIVVLTGQVLRALVPPRARRPRAGARTSTRWATARCRSSC